MGRIGLLGALLCGSAQATEAGRVSLATGVAAMGSHDGGVGGAGSAMLGIGLSDRVGLWAGGREGVASADLRIVGAVLVGATVDLSEHWFMRGGFAHHHETPWESFVEAPIGSTFGAAPGIVHRSGADVGTGLRFPLPAVSTAGLYYAVWAQALVFPHGSDTAIYGVVEQLLVVDFGKKRDANGTQPVTAD